MIWTQVEQQILNSLTKDPVNKDRYMNGKLKMYDEKITTNFHGKSAPYNRCCKATCLLKISSVYQQGSNYYPQVYVEECKYKKEVR